MKIPLIGSMRVMSAFRSKPVLQALCSVGLYVAQWTRLFLGVILLCHAGCGSVKPGPSQPPQSVVLDAGPSQPNSFVFDAGTSQPQESVMLDARPTQEHKGDLSRKQMIEEISAKLAEMPKVVPNFRSRDWLADADADACKPRCAARDQVCEIMDSICAYDRTDTWIDHTCKRVGALCGRRTHECKICGKPGTPKKPRLDDRSTYEL